MVFNKYSWYCGNVYQLPTPNVKIHSFNVLQQVFLCQFQFLECTQFCYEQFNIVHRPLQYFDISRELGDRMRLRLITKRDRELVPHICSYHINKHENHWFNASKVAVKEIWTREYDNTVKLYLRILTCYNPITRVNKPSYHKTRFKQFKYNLDDSKFEVHDIKPVSSIT